MPLGKANELTFDIAIVGGGIAGLSAALRFPAYMSVALFTKGQLGESNTRYAQGGIAVAMGADDSPSLHLQDTLAAGAGLCDEEAVRILVEQGPEAVRWLIQMGVQFDRAQADEMEHQTPDGLLLGREGAHCRWRVLHAGGDATGAEIERALVAAVKKHPAIHLYEETFVQHLLVENGVCVGVEAMRRDGQVVQISAQATILANGGAGGLWLHTSNPSGATADGLALAWQAGAAVTDLEFMQFHPTVLVAGGNSSLISEAVRGEGAYLRNHAGERFMPRYSAQAELAPRDVVARAILSEMLREQVAYEYLDLRHLPAEKMHARFPTISEICQHYGLDLARDLLPIAPAAHYCMGGVLVDTGGSTTVPGLYAVGEVACTGVHGANRLASNSLLEGLVYGIRVGDLLAGKAVEPPPSMQRTVALLTLEDVQSNLPSSRCVDEKLCLQIRREMRQIMWQYVSLSRDEKGLYEAQHQLGVLRSRIQGAASAGDTGVSTPRATMVWIETMNMLLVAQLVIATALLRQESRGSHWRADYQEQDEQLAHLHYVLQLAEGQHYTESDGRQEMTADVTHI